MSIAIRAGGSWTPRSRPPSNRPSSGANHDDAEDRDGVLQPCTQSRRLLEDALETVSPHLVGVASTTSPSAARQPHILSGDICKSSLGLWLCAVRVLKQRSLLALGRRRGVRLFAHALHHVLVLLPSAIEGIVVETLRNQDKVGEAEVDRDGDDGGHETRPDCANEVRDVSRHPNAEEGERDRVGAAIPVVLDQLRHEEEDPARERDAAPDAAERFIPCELDGRCHGGWQESSRGSGGRCEYCRSHGCEIKGKWVWALVCSNNRRRSCQVSEGRRGYQSIGMLSHDGRRFGRNQLLLLYTFMLNVAVGKTQPIGNFAMSKVGATFFASWEYTA